MWRGAQSDLAALRKRPSGCPDGWWKVETDKEVTKRLAKGLEHRKKAELTKVANERFERALMAADEMERCESAPLGRSCAEPCRTGSSDLGLDERALALRKAPRQLGCCDVACDFAPGALLAAKRRKAFSS